MFETLFNGLGMIFSCFKEKLNNIILNKHRNSIVLSFLKTQTQLYDLCADYEAKPNGYFNLIKGAIQSGKSRIIHSLAIKVTMLDNGNVIIIVRDFTVDADQIQKGMFDFTDEFKTYWEEQNKDDIDSTELPTIFYIGDIKRNKETCKLSGHEEMCQKIKEKRAIIISLANSSQLLKLNYCLDILKQDNKDIDFGFNLLIDEVDQVYCSEGIEFKPQLDYLIQHIPTNCIFGITATTYEIFHNEHFGIQRVFVLKPPKNHKNIGDLHCEFIGKINTEKQNGHYDPFYCDSYLRPVLNEFIKKKSYTIKTRNGKTSKHPNIMLLKTDRLIQNQYETFNKICQDEEFKQKLTVILYNSECTTLYSPSLIGNGDKIKFTSGRSINLWKKGSTNEYHKFKKASISQVLQYLKESGGTTKFPHIVIISYEMVGRGINVVSSDFGWHLTDMYYRPAYNVTISTMLQAIRLCGIYYDDIVLTLYIEEAVYKDLYSGYKLQEDYLSRLGKMDDNTSCPEFLENQKFYVSKMPKRRVVKPSTKQIFQVTKNPDEDTGMSITEFYSKDYKIEEKSNEDNTISIVDQKNYPHTKLDRIPKWYFNKKELCGKFLRFLFTQHTPVSYQELANGIGFTGKLFNSSGKAKLKNKFYSCYLNGSGSKDTYTYSHCWITTNDGIILNPIVRKTILEKCY